MLPATFLTLVGGFISTATAIITGVVAPSTIAPNSTITLTLLTSNYIQTVADISVAFALTPRIDPGYLGVDLLGSFYLGPSKSNILSNITFEVLVPASIANADKYLTAIVTSLYGASHGAVSSQYDVPVIIGDKTSDAQSSSTSGSNICSSSSGKRQAASCFPTATTSIIQSSIGFADALIGNIDHENNSTGRQNLGELIGYLGDLGRAIVPACNKNPRTVASAFCFRFEG